VLRPGIKPRVVERETYGPTHANMGPYDVLLIPALVSYTKNKFGDRVPEWFQSPTTLHWRTMRTECVFKAEGPLFAREHNTAVAAGNCSERDMWQSPGGGEGCWGLRAREAAAHDASVLLEGIDKTAQPVRYQELLRRTNAVDLLLFLYIARGPVHEPGSTVAPRLRTAYVLGWKKEEGGRLRPVLVNKFEGDDVVYGGRAFTFMRRWTQVADIKELERLVAACA